jgi:hypothetical protein
MGVQTNNIILIFSDEMADLQQETGLNIFGNK